MNCNELVQLYFERANAMQSYWNAKQVRDLIEPTLTPATYQSVRLTHVTSDILTIAALWAMELRRRKLRETTAAS